MNETTRRTTPYIPGSQPPDGVRLVKLNTNESPYPPSPRIAEAVAAELENLRLYPSPDAAPLRRAFADAYGVDFENVFVSNGSDEALAFIYMAFFDVVKPLATPEIGYSFYPVYARRFGVPLTLVPMINELEVDVATLCALAPHIGVILANPNAPTSICITLSDIRAICESRPNAVVVIDEAYVEFGAETALPLISDYRNLLIVRTLSKSHGLAGLRVGFAVGDAALMDALRRVKDSFNSYPVDRLAIAAAAAALGDTLYNDGVRAAVIAERARLSAALGRLCFALPPRGGFANFLFAKPPGGSGAAASLHTALAERGVLVRHFVTHPAVAPYLRVTVGTPPDTDALLTALQEILSA